MVSARQRFKEARERGEALKKRDPERFKRMRIKTTAERKKEKEEKAKAEAIKKTKRDAKEAKTLFEKRLKEAGAVRSTIPKAPSPAIVPRTKSREHSRIVKSFQKIGDKEREVIEDILVRAEKKGAKKTKDIKLSGLSKAAFERTQQFARTTRKGIPELQKRVSVVSPKTGKVMKYPVESVVRGVETAGMIPGGVEVLVRKPEIIPEALAVGAIQAGPGLVKAAKREPKQFVSDIATLSLLFAGPKAFKAMKPTTKKLFAEEAAQLGFKEPVSGPKPKINFQKTFEQAVAEAQAKTKRTLTAAERRNIRNSVKRSLEKERAEIQRLSQKAAKRQQETLAKQVSREFQRQSKQGIDVEPNTRQFVSKVSNIDKSFEVTTRLKKLEPLEVTLEKLARKERRLKKKLDENRISQTEFNRQLNNIQKKRREAKAFREEAVEIKPVRELKPGKKLKPKTKPKVKPKAEAKVVVLNLNQLNTKISPLVNAFERTLPKVEIEAPTKPKVRVKPGKKVTKKVPAKEVVKRKARRAKAVTTKERIKMPKLPKMKAEPKKKKVVKKKEVKKEFTPFQIKNQIGGISSLF